MKSLKILLFLALFVALYTNVSAQKNKCKYDVEKKDAFSGADYKSVKISMVEGIGPFSSSTYFEFFKNGSDISVNIQFSVNFPPIENVPKGTELIIKLANGEMVQLNSTTETVLKQGLGQGIWTVPFNLTTDNLTKMANSYPTVWKCDFGTQKIQHEISEKNGKKIQDICKCLLQ